MPRPVRHLALIGDLVASRARGDREALQRDLQAWTAERTRRAGPEVLAAPLVLTAGDEVQALVRVERADETVALVQELTDRLLGGWPFPYIVFGVGLGELSTGEPPPPPGQAPNPALLDGPCFQRAREALEGAGGGAWVRFRGFDPPAGEVLDALFDLMGALRAGWAARQGEYTVRARGAPSQKAVAEALGVSPSVISEGLKAAHFETVRAGEDAARALLRRVAEEAVR